MKAAPVLSSKSASYVTQRLDSSHVATEAVGQLCFYSLIFDREKSS